MNEDLNKIKTQLEELQRFVGFTPIKVKVKTLSKKTKLPKKGIGLAAGCDVYATEIVHKSNDQVYCKLKLAMQPPDNCMIMIVPRSNITKTTWVLQNSPAIIDPDYIDDIQLRFRAFPTSYSLSVNDHNIATPTLCYDEFPYKEGERIAQYLLLPIMDFELENVDNLDVRSMRKGGFGSSGLK